MRASEPRHERVNAALQEADEILERQRDCGIRLKCTDCFDKRIVLLGAMGQPTTEAELLGAPASFREAWSHIVAEPLSRVALYYALFFSDQTLDNEEAAKAARLEPCSDCERARKGGVPTVLSVFAQPPKSSGADNVIPAKEALLASVEVYLRRFAQVEPRNAARLTRAIRAGARQLHSSDLVGDDAWFFWALELEMPKREDFADLDPENPNVDRRAGTYGQINRYKTIGDAIGRGIGDSMVGAATALLRDDDGRPTAEILEDLLESARPVVNVYAAPSLAEFVLMCIAGSVIVCSVILGFRLLRLL